MNKLLVALDGSTAADTVLSAAISLAILTRSKLALFRAVWPRPAKTTVAAAAPDEALEGALRQDAEKYLAWCTRAVPPGMLAGTRVTVGAPWEAVCVAARDDNVDLVVIGAGGFGGADGHVGTTAAEILHHIDRHTLVVRSCSTQGRLAAR